MKRSTWAHLALATGLAVALWGCGSNLGSDGSSTSPGAVREAQTRGLDNCLTCHLGGVGQAWLAGPHSNPNATPAASLANPACLACHDQLGDGLLLAAATAGARTDRPVVGCESCHGGGQFHSGVGPLPVPLPGPAQCGQCHGIEGPLFHDSPAGLITHDTHFDNPATGFQADTNGDGVPDADVAIEGYVVKAGDARGCQVCHFNGHTLALEYNRAWADSAHGGHLLAVKAADPAAAVRDADAPGWTHYNWDQTTGSGNRASCQRCHTATGAANYLDDPAGYDPAMNDFTHLSGWTPATGSPQNEMLYCWGCHSDNQGSLRNPGALTVDYTGAPATYPDALASNVCLACHTGRESGGTIAARAANPATNWGDLGFINSHYLTAGGTVFSVTGYHYPGLEYQAPGNLHARVGTPDSIGGAIGNNGPCVKCHMSTPGAGGSHTFHVVTHDAAGAITAINPTFCTACHTGALTLTVPGINGARAGFEAALDALEAQLAAKGFPFQANFPYFPTRNWGDAATGPGNMGAAFNFNLLVHDPGAYAHNTRYAARLIWDSLDWLDDNALNGSARAAINALPAADLPAATKAEALAWIGLARP
ncbi:MAG: hypothetical protein ACYDA8_07145 [Deferrisomatales bacterium]